MSESVGGKVTLFMDKKSRTRNKWRRKSDEQVEGVRGSKPKSKHADAVKGRGGKVETSSKFCS